MIEEQDGAPMTDGDQPASRTRFREPTRTTAAREPVAPASSRTKFTEPRTVTMAKQVTEPVPLAVADRPERRSGALAVVATSVAVVMLAAAVVFAVLYVRSRNDASTLADTRTTVLRTAQKTAIDFSSYDYRHLSRDFAGVAAQLTPKFRKSYNSTAGALKATLSQYRAVGTAKVLDAGVATLSGDKATVVVFLDQTVTSKTSATPTVDRNRIRVSLERDGSRWLVSKLDVR